MKITFLGTAAAEGCPALFCQCETCENAKKLGGKNIRTRAQTLINDDLLIDFSPDTYFHVLEYGLNLDLVKNILITHSHGDHLLPDDISYRMKGFCGKRPDFMLNVHSNSEVFDVMTKFISRTYVDNSFYNAVTLNKLEPFKEYQVGEYKIYPLLAFHMPDEQAFCYIISDKENKTLLYAHDTGWIPQASWDFLSKFHFDAASLDCTTAFVDCETGHMGINCCKKVKDKMLELGCADENTAFVLNHFSHNGKLLSFEHLQKEANKLGFDVSYDKKEMVI